MHRRLVYASQTTRFIPPPEVATLIEVSRRNNTRADVTGLLIYDAGMFFQVLEGAFTGVASTFERIRLDPRHTDVTVLADEDIAVRGFSGWKMGYSSPSSLPPDARSAVMTLTRLAAFNSPERGRDAHIRAVVRTFLDTMRGFHENRDLAAAPRRAANR